MTETVTFVSTSTVTSTATVIQPRGAVLSAGEKVHVVALQTGQQTFTALRIIVQHPASRATEGPDAAQEPDVTDVPGAAAVPEATTTPEATQVPDATQVPEATQAPEAPESPDTTGGSHHGQDSKPKKKK